MKKRKTRKVALLLAALMLTASLAGCGDEAVEQKESQAKDSSEVVSQSSDSGAGEETSTDTTDTREPITIEHLAFSNPEWTEDWKSFIYDSPVYKELVERTGVTIQGTALDNDQVNIRIAGGELGDLITVYNGDQLSALVESEQVYALNELIEEYAPHIIENFPDLWQKATELYANDEGLAYALPVKMGDGGVSDTNGRYLYTVRWDLYEELGYPEMKNPEDLIEVLADMIELQPTTPEGKKVYGEGFYVTETSYFGMVGNFQGTYGMTNLKGHYITRNVLTNELIYDMTEDGSPYWMAVEYYNKAQRAGILDPDSFTQQEADFSAKIKSGELIHGIYYNTSWENEQRAKDPNFDKGYANIPVEGCSFYQNGDNPTGWNISYAMVIPKSCKDPERVAQFIGDMFTEEMSRLVTSGVEGVHWDWVDGEPVYNEETKALITAGGDEYKKTGIGVAPLIYMVGYLEGYVASDGFHIDIKQDTPYKASKEYSPVLQRFCEYYDVSWPNEIFVQWRDAGKMYDLFSIDKRLSLGTPTEEISRIDAACMKIAIEAIPKLVNAPDDATFESVKAETMAALEAAGGKEAESYYKEMWAQVRAKYPEYQ